MSVYESRLLPADEWSKLEHTESFGPCWRQLRPQATEIPVVEKCGQIIATWGLFPFFHAEGIWVDPRWRQNPAVLRHLWREMKQAVTAHGAEAVITNANSEEVRTLLQTAGAKNLSDPSLGLGDPYLLRFTR